MQLSWNRTLIFEYFEGEKSTYLFALNAFVSLCCFGLALKIIFLKKTNYLKISFGIFGFKFTNQLYFRATSADLFGYAKVAQLRSPLSLH